MEVLTSVAADAAPGLLAQIIKHIGYICKYKENLDRLKAAAEELDARRKVGRCFAEEIKRKQRSVADNVSLWQSKADKLSQDAKENIDRNDISCLNLWSRYSKSKSASKMAVEINEMVLAAPDFGNDCDRPLPKSGDKFNLRGFMEFESRLTVLNKVLEALKDEEVSMCNICGMGGVGKTTLAKKLIQRVEDDNLFDKVIMVILSQNPDFEKIQNEIIEKLQLKVSENTMAARSIWLNDWLTKNRTLLILDDVWRQLDDEDFEKIGIPLRCNTCKIVVTSRIEDECKKMGSQRTFLIETLKEGEAWDLFRWNAGECVDDLALRETARKIADECDGLPIAIVAIAKALKDKPKTVWDDSLQQLQKSNLPGISGMERMYSRIQLSYDLLMDEEAESCFLLCCLFPEDHIIKVDHLVSCCKGLRLLKHVKTMKETRDRVESKIDKLKNSNMLLEGEEDGTVKMHDVFRDFAISISSKDKHSYIVTCEKVMKDWPDKSQLENCTAISFVCDEIEIPVDLSCPKLELLQLIYSDDQVGLPIGLFEGMKELKVLLLKVPSLFQSGDKKVDGIFSVLTKLRTLVIYESTRDYHETTKIGDLLGHDALQDLEILEWSRGDYYYEHLLYDDFPEEIGGLCNLRRLNLREMKFKYIGPDILSKLKDLEELELPWAFDKWGYKKANGESVNAGLEEIGSLPLTTLKICVPKGSILAEKLVKNLTRFHVCLGHYGQYSEECSAVLQVVDVDVIDITVSWISVLLRKCEQLQLQQVRNLMNIMCLQQSAEDHGFPQLKYLEVSICDEMEYLVEEQIPSTFLSHLKTLKLFIMENLKEIWNFSKIKTPCFSNLCEITIFLCQKMKHVFPLSVAREFTQLQHMVVNGCEKMEEIIYNDEIYYGDQIVDENIEKVFPQLKTLELMDMHKLRVFYDRNHAIELPELEQMNIARCNNMEALSYGSFYTPILKQIQINWIDYYPTAGEDLNAFLKKTVVILCFAWS
ncbi:probable disease resistance protein At4g27220 isoform X2 [Euphorbia lathyris]|uniref:probable disease resistance protein At4g27220 isoform X2 n=1 Tax=Euphorbia lathyris TaxID=212925 RepID=UPI0033138114